MSNRIAVSIGNTRICCGIFIDGQLRDVHYWLDTQLRAARDDLIDLSRQFNVQDIALCSVVPAAHEKVFERLQEHGLDVFKVSTETQTLLTGTYASLGADRLANAAAAFKLYARETPAIVLDFGTATTLTGVTNTGQFLGGLIMLGLGSNASALHQLTAQLPDLQFDIGDSALTAFAADTEQAIKSGCLLGHVGAIEHWVKTARQTLNSEITVIATGGYCELMRSQTNAIDHCDRLLTIRGVNFIAEAAMGLKDRD